MNTYEKKPKRTNIFTKIIWWFRRKSYQQKPSKMELWALNELKMLEGQETEEEKQDGMQCLVTKEVMDIVKLFCKQGHSGFSASYVLNLLRRLLDRKPILPLTGEDDEWEEVEEWNKTDNTQQNKRCSAVFRNNFDNSTAYYLYGKVFTDDGGKSWFTNHDSFVPVKFPYYVPLESEKVYLTKEEETE